jgi:antitoxin (DNA-binding transcriptional repressor) of toxin-antitoxin stability system
MRAVGLKVLENKLSEYVRLAAGGETVLVTDRDRVVAELVPPREGRSPFPSDAMLAELVRRGWALLERVTLVELTPLALARALEPFPVPVRTLDALHLATVEFLRSQGQPVELAAYDERLRAAGRALGVPLRTV